VLHSSLGMLGDVRAAVAAPTRCTASADAAAEYHDSIGSAPAAVSQQPTQWLKHDAARVQDAEQGSKVALHVYHVSHSDAVRRLNRVTGGSRNPLKFGGVFHAGIEVNGREWSYGATEDPEDTGIAWNVPTRHSMHQFYSTVELGETKLTPDEVNSTVRRLMRQWPGYVGAFTQCLSLGARAFDLRLHSCARHILIHFSIGATTI
jgi:hypothetical protein